MELKEAKDIYINVKKYKEIYGNIDTKFFLKFAETMFQELEGKEKKINQAIKYIQNYKYQNYSGGRYYKLLDDELGIDLFSILNKKGEKND